MNLEIIDCSDEDIDLIYSGLTECVFENVPEMRGNRYFEINKKICEGGRTVAGCIAEVFCWKALHVDALWVDDEFRRRGLGSRLLEEVEKIAAEKECNIVHLSTFDFQAKDFYLKHGYEIFGVLENSPAGHRRYFMKKELR